MALTFTMATRIKNAQIVNSAACLIPISLLTAALGLTNQINTFDRISSIARAPAPISQTIVRILQVYLNNQRSLDKIDSHSYSLPGAPFSPFPTCENYLRLCPGIGCICPSPCRDHPNCGDWSWKFQSSPFASIPPRNTRARNYCFIAWSIFDVLKLKPQKSRFTHSLEHVLLPVLLATHALEKVWHLLLIARHILRQLVTGNKAETGQPQPHLCRLYLMSVRLLLCGG